MKFIFKVHQPRKSSSNNDPTKTMPNKRNPLQCLRRKELNNMIFDLTGQTIAHITYIIISQLLVRRCAEIRSLWKKQRYVVFYQFHIQRISLETMNQHYQMQSFNLFLALILLLQLLFLTNSSIPLKNTLHKKWKNLLLLNPLLIKHLEIQIKFTPLTNHFLIIHTISIIIRRRNAQIIRNYPIHFPQMTPKLLLLSHIYILVMRNCKSW